MDDFTRGFNGIVDDVSPESANKKWVIHRINTDSIDTYKTVISPEGMNKKDYDKSRIVLWEHGQDVIRGRVPIGRNEWIKSRKESRDIIAKTTFASDEFGNGLYTLYRDGFLKAWSVMGKPSKEPGDCTPPTKDEIRRRPELSDCKMMYRKWSLSEYSSVVLAGNLDALTEEVGRAQAESFARAMMKGLWVPEIIRTKLESLPDLPTKTALPKLVGKTMEDVQAVVLRKLQVEIDRLTKTMENDILEIARGRI